MLLHVRPHRLIGRRLLQIERHVAQCDFLKVRIDIRHKRFGEGVLLRRQASLVAGAALLLLRQNVDGVPFDFVEATPQIAADDESNASQFHFVRDQAQVVPMQLADVLLHVDDLAEHQVEDVRLVGQDFGRKLLVEPGIFERF